MQPERYIADSEEVHIEKDLIFFWRSKRERKEHLPRVVLAKLNYKKKKKKSIGAQHCWLGNSRQKRICLEPQGLKAPGWAFGELQKEVEWEIMPARLAGPSHEPQPCARPYPWASNTPHLPFLLAPLITGPAAL